MKISALIAEFNPFHAGHKLLIDSMKAQSDGVIAIMSGNFVQRGECAVFEKSDRATAAIKNGVDLVLELPAAYALSSAEGFARGAVRTLSATGIVDSLHFGSESGDISPLLKCADALNEESPDFCRVLSDKLSEGLSYPAARQSALMSVCPEGNILDTPNNILAVEYLRELKSTGSEITPITIKRLGSGYNDTDIKEEIPSASAIRAILREGKSAQSLLLHNYSSKPVFSENLDLITAARLKAISEKELCLLPDCNSEIAARLKESARFNTFGEIVLSASCKRYPQSRIRRILCYMITGNSFSTLPEPSYIRPLAFNKKGGEILRKMKSTASLPIAARGASFKNDSIFNYECRCTDIYNLVKGTEGGMEFSFIPLQLD